MSFKKLRPQAASLLICLVASPVFAHVGDPGHEHSSIEQFFTGLAYAAIVFFVAIVIGIIVKSSSNDINGDNA